MTSAIACIENAHEIYEANDEDDEEKNHHGIGLTSYTLGYIYEMFADVLCEDSKFAKHFSEDEKNFLRRNETDNKVRALRYYEQAYTHFKKVHHIVGMYMCLTHES